MTARLAAELMQDCMLLTTSSDIGISKATDNKNRKQWVFQQNGVLLTAANTLDHTAAVLICKQVLQKRLDLEKYMHEDLFCAMPTPRANLPRTTPVSSTAVPS